MRRRVAAAAAILIILLGGFGSVLIRQGFTHVLPASMLRWSRELWDQGMYVDSVRWFVNAHEDALDAGLRWSAARTYLDAIPELRRNGKLDEALKNCAHAVQILDGHDDEGNISYLCVSIEALISRQE